MGKYKVYVYGICKNESKFAQRWMQSMGEADGIYVLDTGSTDDTVERLKALGAQVKQEAITPWRFDTARNRSLTLVPEDADICVCTDLDEVLEPGWRKALEDGWQSDTKRVTYRYTWSFLPDGREGTVFYTDKIHARQGFRWVNPVHEVLEYSPGGAYKMIKVEGIQLNHLPDPKKSRAQYLPLLELAVAENPDNDRNMHYLGREYMFRQNWDACICTLERHLRLPTATWADERCASMRFIARAWEAKGEDDKAEQWLLRACGEAPHLREPFMDLAMYHYRHGHWHWVTAACLRAMEISNRPDTYMTDSAAWGSLPYDLAALGYYYSGDSKTAIKMMKEAVKLSPQDERLKNNMKWMLKS